MRRVILFLFVLMFLSYSCSSDNLTEVIEEGFENRGDDNNDEDTEDESTDEEDMDDTDEMDEDDMDTGDEMDEDDMDTGDDMDDTDEMDEDDMDTGDDMDNTDEMDEEASIDIIGTWDLTAINFDDSNASLTVRLLVNFLESILEEGCDALVLSFNEDGTLIIDRRDFSAAMGGDLTVECPEDVITDNTTWEAISENQILVTFEDGTTRTITVEVDGDTAIVGADVINLFGDVVSVEELGESTVVFTRR